MRKLLLFVIAVISILSITSIGQTRFKDIDYWTAHGIFKAFDSKGRDVENTADRIKDKYPGEYGIDQVCSAFNYLYRNWQYKSDPNGMEYFEDGNDVITNPEGDCDDYAIGMVSLIVALGGDARVVCVTGHAYPEVYLGKNLEDNDIEKILERINNFYQKNYRKRSPIRELNYHRDYDDTYWMNLDWQTSYPGGRFHEYSRDASHLVIYTDGSYRKAFLNRE